MDLTLEVSPAALAELAKVGFDPVFGARPLKRAIQQRIENPLRRFISNPPPPTSSANRWGSWGSSPPGITQFNSPLPPPPRHWPQATG
jgi:ATP-dependent Clp protease ATP-binding subunit ClpB